MQDPFEEEVVAKATAALSRVAVDGGTDESVVRQLLTVPPKEEMGEFALPCFSLAKQLRKNPVMIAEEVAALIEPGEHIARIEAAGPYVNFTVDRSQFIPRVLGEICRAETDFGNRGSGDGKTLVIDFSSPNLAKPFSIAHLRSTAIGHSIYRIHRQLGWHCVGINYLGDWGANFGQLLVAYRTWGDEEKVRSNPVPELMALYVRFNKELDDHPELQDEARDCVQALAAGDDQLRDLWSFFTAESRNEADRIYQVLGVEFDEVAGESNYDAHLDAIEALFREKNLAVDSEGAVIVDLDEWDMSPCMLRTSKGTSTYHSRDIAALLERHEKYQFDKMVYVTDVGQKLHFQQVFKAVELLGSEWSGRCQHAPFGMLRFKGAKMSTRKGVTIFLEDVLNQAVELTREIIAAKNPSLQNKEQIAHEVGISAVIFADLDSRRTRDVVFDWDEILNFDGETGPYLQYTHARFCSILRRYGKKIDGKANLSLLTEDAEMRVTRQLSKFPDCLEQAQRENEPSFVASYLIELATVANKFYNELPVLAGNDQTLIDARVVLVDCTRVVLRTGLGLLGMRSPEEM